MVIEASGVALSLRCAFSQQWEQVLPAFLANLMIVFMILVITIIELQHFFAFADDHGPDFQKRFIIVKLIFEENKTYLPHPQTIVR